MSVNSGARQFGLRLALETLDKFIDVLHVTVHAMLGLYNETPKDCCPKEPRMQMSSCSLMSISSSHTQCRPT